MFVAPPPSGVAGLSPTQVRAQLVRMGWSPLPIRTHDADTGGAGKAPGIRGWAERALFEAAGATRTDLKTWERREREWPGTGIACGHIIAIDNDFGTDAHLAGRVHALTLDVFGPTPFERQGAYPKSALVYRAAEPIRSKSLKAADGSGDGIDILAERRQVVAFGVHRKTVRPYSWIGAESPLTASPDAAPEITQAQVDDFLRRLCGLVELSQTGGRDAGSGGDGGGTIVRNAVGRVVDGREYHLTRTVYGAALDLKAKGIELTATVLTERAWEAFTASTVLDDKRWKREAAREKSEALLARVRCGQVELDLKPASTVTPSYPDRRVEVDEAERAVLSIRTAFFNSHIPVWMRTRDAWAAADHGAKEAGSTRPDKPTPISWGARIETAIGKTEQAISGAVEATHQGLTVIFAVPTHRLGSEIVDRFARHDIVARAYHGYEAPDPDVPSVAMCLDLPAVRDAQEAGVSSILRAVCKRRTDQGQMVRCRFFDRCGMTRQRKATPDLWVVPHSLLFSARPAFIPRPDAIIVDEGIVMSAIPDKPVLFTLDAMDRSDVTQSFGTAVFSNNANDLEIARGNFIRALRDHKDDGPLQRGVLLLHGVTEVSAAGAHRLEWQRLMEPGIVPAMEPQARRARVARTAQHNLEVKRWAGIWAELGTFLAGDAGASGRLSLRYDKESEVRNLERRSLATIKASWIAPALILDATLPEPSLLEPVFGHPVEVRADISARWSPHGRVRQIVGAPVTAQKLGIIEGREPEVPKRVVTDLVRLIRLRAALIEQARTVVVIGPKRLIEKLTEAGLPPNVETGHFGAIAGIDRWADAAGLICIGRLLPGPLIVEGSASVVTGCLPQAVAQPSKPGGAFWYDRTVAGIRLASGEGVQVHHCRHPDPTAEALRWQICEAGLIQAIGRLRALRRGASSPFFLDIISDVPLPISVDCVETWEEAKPDAWADMVQEGVLLSSAADVMACFPEAAPTRKAARLVADLTLAPTLTRKLSIGVGAKLTEASYKRFGRYAPVQVIVLPNGPADLKAWLFDRLGAIDWVTAKATAPTSIQDAATAVPPAEYGLYLTVLFRLVAEFPADAHWPEPVKAEVVRFGPEAVYGRLLDNLRTGKLTGAGGAQTLAITAALAAGDVSSEVTCSDRRERARPNPEIGGVFQPLPLVGHMAPVLC